MKGGKCAGVSEMKYICILSHIQDQYLKGYSMKYELICDQISNIGIKTTMPIIHY